MFELFVLYYIIAQDAGERNNVLSSNSIPPISVVKCKTPHYWISMY